MDSPGSTIVSRLIAAACAKREGQDFSGALADLDAVEEFGSASQIRTERIETYLAWAKARNAEANLALQKLLELDPQHFEGRAMQRQVIAFPARRVGTTWINSMGMEFVYLTNGTFQMGSPDSERDRKADEGPRHTVTITKRFALGVTPVTQAHWRAVMGNNPSRFKGDDRPVEQVSWIDSDHFCQTLTKAERRTGHIGLTQSYRLPTEAEWEYACRAGTKGPFAGTGQIEDMGWYHNNSGGQTQPVKHKQSNAWGLHDMHGNVWEWCEDVYHINYASAPADGTAWVGGGGAGKRVLRGGSVEHASKVCRAAKRRGHAPEDAVLDIGFRVALDAP